MTTKSAPAADASAKIDRRIAELGDWRGATLARLRALIHEADPAVVEEWKWMGTPIWSHDGIVCTGESYKQVVKLTFARGAALADPHELFNASLDGNVRRAIDVREGETIDATAFGQLVRSAVQANVAALAERAAKKAAGRKAPATKTAAPPTSGGKTATKTPTRKTAATKPAAAKTAASKKAASKTAATKTAATKTAATKTAAKKPSR